MSAVVSVTVTHSELPINVEKRYAPELTVKDLKEKLYMQVGTEPSSQQLQLLQEGQVVEAAMDDDKTLADYGAAAGGAMTLHVLDLDAASMAAQLGSASLEEVAKVEISDTKYAERTDNARAFRASMVKKKKPPLTDEQKAEAKVKAAAQEVQEAALAEALEVGMRVLVDGSKRGEIKWIGKAPFAQQQQFVGVALDLPLGKNDGSVKGERFFECEAKHGSMVKPSKLQAGDFPVEAPEDVDEEL